MRDLSPRTKERLQEAAVWLLALSLPFVLVWVLVKGLINYLVPRKLLTETEREQQFNLAEWQATELNRYRSMSFSFLNELPSRTDILPPPEIGDYRFVLAKREGDNGGVEIQLSPRRKFLFIELFSGPSFEMLPNGTVLSDEDYEPED